MVERAYRGRRIRGLTLHRPWPWAFTHADKRVENRSWHPPEKIIGGYLALHAGKRFDRVAAQNMRDGLFSAMAMKCPVKDDEHPSGVIVAVARVTGFYVTHPDLEPLGSWAFGPIAWKLRPRIEVLREPVACRGWQGLWRLPDGVLDAIEAQTEAGA